MELPEIISCKKKRLINKVNGTKGIIASRYLKVISIQETCFLDI